MRGYGKVLLAGLLVAVFVMVNSRAVLANDNTGFLRIENYDSVDYSFRIDPHAKTIMMTAGVSQALPILVRAGSVVRVVVKDNYYTLKMLAEHHPVRLRVKDDRTTTLTIQRGGASGYDLLAVVSRRGHVRSRSTLQGSAIARHHTPPVVVHPQPYRAPVVIVPQPHHVPVVVPHRPSILVYPQPHHFPVVVQPYHGGHGSSHYRPYTTHHRVYRHHSYPVHHQSHRSGFGITLRFGH